MAALDKAGASNSARPAVCPSGLSTGRTGTGQDLNHRAKLRALAEAMGGPRIVRDTDGNGYLLTVEALKFIPLSHEALNA